MTSRERVTTVINHGKPDRIPINAWLGNEEFAPKVIGKYGSLDAFARKYGFDISGNGLGLQPFRFDLIHEAKKASPDGRITPDKLLGIPFTDLTVGDERLRKLKDSIDAQHGEGGFVQSGTWGFFEGYTVVFGLEDTLVYLMLYKDEFKELNRRLAEWHTAHAAMLVDAGLDMYHFSDDWGAQRSLMFNPDLWWELVHPYYKDIVAMIHGKGSYVSLHSDGNVAEVMDGLVDIGIDVLHPYQESAGMDMGVFLDRYAGKITIMGGLDVQTTIGFGRYGFLRDEIDRVLTMFRDGGLIYMSSHAVQPHCTVEELEFAFDHIHAKVRELGAGAGAG
ncbi:MAG: uroporphyrinogen decarboxylase family protein [Oscillospiraceae bacterium]|nr:uroporphyrinogen decarboxylase family protein [Oscillospiraceae bacterium]